MKVNIFREIPWFGGNYFHPKYYDESVFRMESCLRAGKLVPTHYHKYFDEHWLVLKGNPVFVTPEGKFSKQQGETFIGPKMIPHSIVNNTNEDVVLQTEMYPCADMAKMMSVIAGLQDDGEKNWMFKYFYIEKRAGLKEFSTPTATPVKIMTALIMPLVMLIGRLAGWDKFKDKYF